MTVQELVQHFEGSQFHETRTVLYYCVVHANAHLVNATTTDIVN